MTVAVVGNNIMNLRMSSNRIAYGPKVIDVKSCAYGRTTGKEEKNYTRE